MLKTRVLITLLICAGVLASVQPARAQQTLNFTLGGFVPLGEDARGGDDVLTADRTFLTFHVGDFAGATVGGEWLLPLGRYFEAGAGVSYSRQTVPSVYTSFVDNSGAEIRQNLRLRIVPTAFTFRVLPLGQSSGIQPYLGAGLGIFSWRYSEYGDFVNFDVPGRPVSRGSFVDSGSETGPIGLAGLRFAGDTLSAGGEVRYQRAHANLNNQFAGSRIDLGGWTYQFTLGMRFGK